MIWRASLVPLETHNAAPSRYELAGAASVFTEALKIPQRRLVAAAPID